MIAPDETTGRIMECQSCNAEAPIILDVCVVGELVDPNTFEFRSLCPCPCHRSGNSFRKVIPDSGSPSGYAIHEFHYTTEVLTNA